jgi:ribosomal protein S1
MDEVKQNPAPVPISEIKPKTRIEGTVAKIELFGALVDVGAERPGLLHISQMRTDEQEHINRVSDVLTVGSTVTVWVKQVDLEKNLINLTMTEPALYDWADLKKTLQVVGRVTRVTDFGAFVDFKGPREGLIPAGQLSRQRINKPSDVISEGDEVEPWIVSGDTRIGVR